jgi:hypothetical protein
VVRFATPAIRPRLYPLRLIATVRTLRLRDASVN